MSVREALEIHCTGGTSYGTSATALANRRVNGSNATDKGGAVRAAEFLIGISNSTVRTYTLTRGAAVTKKLIRLCNAGVAGQLILGK